MRTMNPWLALASLTVLSLVACGGARQSRQLLEARTVNIKANEGYARKYAPADLVEANKLMKRAEEADDGSKEEVHLSYLADRTSRLAASRGAQAYNRELEADAAQRYLEGQERRRAEAEANLEATRDKLEDTSAALQARSGDVASLESSKSQLQTQLEREKAARAAAEGKAAAAMESLRSFAQVRQSEQETVITLAGAVLFKTGESKLMPGAEESLARVADALKSIAEERSIVVEGHTDSVGSDQANLELSRARAESVRSFLVSRGLTPEQVQAKGMGEGKPVASNDTPEGRANNRRVELVVAKDGEQGRQASR